MAYNSYFPVGYSTIPQYPQYQQNFNPNSYQNPQQQQTQQIQNGGYLTVRSEEEARNYPIAPGNSVTFFNETQPYCYKKTMGFSPLDRPTFEKYRIVKEEDVIPEVQTGQQADNAFEQLRAEVDDLKEKVRVLMEGKKHDESKSKRNHADVSKNEKQPG